MNSIALQLRLLQILRQIDFNNNFNTNQQTRMIQVSLSRGPKRRGISLSLTPKKQDNPSFQESNKVNLSAQPLKNFNQYQVFNPNPAQGFAASGASRQPVATINVATPNTVYYVQSKQNVSFSYSQASEKNKPLSESIMLDKKINELQSQIAQKHSMLKQMKNISQRPSPGKKFVEVTQNVIKENIKSDRYQNHVVSYPIPYTASPIIININQNKTPSNAPILKKEQQFNPISKFQAIQISTIPIVSQQDHNNFRHQKHQQSQLTIYNHQDFEIKPPGTYPTNYKISPQRKDQPQNKIAPQKTQNFLNAKNIQKQVQKSSQQRTQNFLNAKNTQKQAQKSVQKKDKSPKKKKLQAKQQQNSKEVRSKEAKQNIKVQRANLDFNKLKIMESKLLDIIKVCQQGL